MSEGFSSGAREGVKVSAGGARVDVKVSAAVHVI